MLNKVMVIGNLGRDAEVRYTPGGVGVINFSVASTEKWTGKDGQKQERTEWFSVDYWAKNVEALGEYLVKGKTVYVEGKLQTADYTDKDGVKRKSVKVRADRVVMLGGREIGGERQAAPHVRDEDMSRHSEPLTDDDIPF